MIIFGNRNLPGSCKLATGEQLGGVAVQDFFLVLIADIGEQHLAELLRHGKERGVGTPDNTIRPSFFDKVPDNIHILT